MNKKTTSVHTFASSADVSGCGAADGQTTSVTIYSDDAHQIYIVSLRCHRTRKINFFGENSYRKHGFIHTRRQEAHINIDGMHTWYH
jgi:hypothetical protein